MFTDGSQLCAQTDPEMFFTDESTSGIRSYYRHEQDAKKICSLCPLKDPCLEYALKYPELDGIWGGTTPAERMRLRRRSA